MKAYTSKKNNFLSFLLSDTVFAFLSFLLIIFEYSFFPSLSLVISFIISPVLKGYIFACFFSFLSISIYLSIYLSIYKTMYLIEGGGAGVNETVAAGKVAVVGGGKSRIFYFPSFLHFFSFLFIFRELTSDEHSMHFYFTSGDQLSLVFCLISNSTTISLSCLSQKSTRGELKVC
ncbi:unnamed protein product [Acanthosepion pharaonis]|uniref:Uncharacterized protein n=1 Tax=Acanthosepion pharaonis TaxID=158019 RepID=A0A812BC59_ACAPH|nr:unnamed protein product [Sepia pharaonis]